MALTFKQQFSKCCGFFCAMLACVGVYFWFVLAFWQSQKSLYNIYIMEKLNSTSEEAVKNFETAFWIVSAVSCVASSFS